MKTIFNRVQYRNSQMHRLQGYNFNANDISVYNLIYSSGLKYNHEPKKLTSTLASSLTHLRVYSLTTILTF